MTDTDQHFRCPLAAIDRRLEQVHQHWHEAEQAYFHPQRFLVAIQTAIQTLRTVTFILQSNKRLFPQFDAWYDPWQQKLKADPLMKWMVDARNKIEKVGDLEMHSFVRAEIMASYYNDGPRQDVPAELFQSPKELICSMSNDAFRAHAFKDGVLRLQRRWVENTLPDFELLDAVAIAYGKLSELVDDAHRQLGLSTPLTTGCEEEDHEAARIARGGRLRCMIGHGDVRTQNVWLATGDAMELKQTRVEFDKNVAEKAAKQWKLKPRQPVSIAQPIDLMDELFDTARQMITASGYHDTIAFLLHGKKPVGIVQLAAQEHGEKYLLLRNLAHEVLKRGADGVILMGEIWKAPFDPTQPYRRAAEAPVKEEYLSAWLVTKEGDPVYRCAKILRKGKKLGLGETETYTDQAPIILSPVYEAWGRQIPPAWSDGLKARDGA